MKTIIRIILAVLLFLTCAWAANTSNEIGYPICPSPLCGGN